MLQQTTPNCSTGHQSPTPQNNRQGKALSSNLEYQPGQCNQILSENSPVTSRSTEVPKLIVIDDNYSHLLKRDVKPPLQSLPKKWPLSQPHQKRMTVWISLKGTVGGEYGISLNSRQMKRTFTRTICRECGSCQEGILIFYPAQTLFLSLSYMFSKQRSRTELDWLWSSWENLACVACNTETGIYPYLEKSNNRKICVGALSVGEDGLAWQAVGQMTIPCSRNSNAGGLLQTRVVSS